MLDAVRHDQEFPCLQLHRAVAELNPQAPTNHEKEFILYLVMVPDESSFAFDELDLLSVKLTDDLSGLSQKNLSK